MSAFVFSFYPLSLPVNVIFLNASSHPLPKFSYSFHKKPKTNKNGQLIRHFTTNTSNINFCQFQATVGAK